MIRCLLLITLLLQVSSAQKHGGPDGGNGGDPGPDVGGGADPGPGGGVGGAVGGKPPGPVKNVKIAHPEKKWPTLSGYPPLIIARGGFSGLFPEASVFAVDMALSLTNTDVALFCNLQLTKDGVGVCLSDIRLNNATNIGEVFPDGSKTYKINGQNVTGWFAKDYSSDVILSNVSLIQSVVSRTIAFDNQLPVATVEDIKGVQPPFLWLNVEYDVFYNENKLSMSDFFDKTGLKGISYISSPEIGFLKKMVKKITNDTRLVFTFLGKDVVEPTSKKKYGDILKDLKSIKDFASGILVPKDYVWPLDENRYLGKRTTLLADAHKMDIEVSVSGFANDMPGSYNYTYDPTAEYLQFINDPDIIIDGFVTDFSPTASNAIVCFATNDKKKKKKRGKGLIISHNGASGEYPGCTDLAYEQAVTDGVDVIDCKVQMTKDGVAFCLDSPDLTGDTTALSTFLSKSSSVPEIQKDKGIFSFDLTWNEIQSLKPQILSPYLQTSGLARNPAAKNKGKFMTLNDFLGFAKTKKVSGVLIGIENAAYLASKKGLAIVKAVTETLKNASLDKTQVMIQSDDTSVLSEFKGDPAYKRLLKFKETLGSASKGTAKEIKKYADGVVVTRPSLIVVDGYFTQSRTNVLKEMRNANLSVYVYVMKNEFVAIPFDFYSDPILELATYIVGEEVDGVITEFPATASRYLRSPCADPNSEIQILAAEAGNLVKEVPPGALPPVNAPHAPLDMKDVVDPPLPPVTAAPDLESKGPPPPATPGAPPPSSGTAVAADIVGVCVAAFMALCLLLSMGH